MQSIKYLLFDHDGVLVDTEYWYFKATQRAIADLGVDMPFEKYQQHLVDGSPSWDLAREIGSSEEAINVAKQSRDRIYQGYLVSEYIDIEGVEETLSELAKDYAMAIVTTSKRSDFELIHKNRNLVPYMDFVLCNGDYPRTKPHPDPYQTALARFGGMPDEALVIEDSARGLRSALAAGIRCVTVHNEFTAHQDLSAADYRIQTLDALPSLLSGSG